MSPDTDTQVRPASGAQRTRRTPRHIARWTVGVLCVLALVIAAGFDANSSGSRGDARSKLVLIAPAAAGGGWDLVARETQQSLRANSIVNNVQVVNVPGAAGTIGLGQLPQMRGDGSTMMVTGTVMLGGIALNRSAVTLADTTPIARLAEDFEVIAVPTHSSFETLDDLIAQWQQDPAALPIGGGSAGGVDHLVAAQLARDIGIDPGDLRYSAYAGGGELTISLLSTAPGTPEVGISGYNDFRDLITDGRFRVLAVVAPERLAGLDAPTMAEAGYPDVNLVNWRGLVAPPGITPEQQEQLIEIVSDMRETPEWQDAVARNRWQESFLTGDEFGAFLIDEQTRIDGILDELGLT